MASALVQQIGNVDGLIATVVLEADQTEPVSPGELADTVASIQAAGIATLISGDATLARVVKADGVHLPPSKSALPSYREARDILGGRHIVGVDVGRTRHDGMVLGEEGADYIAFGIPAHVEDRDTARKRRLELISWWSEIFEPPCVAFDVETPDDARELAEAGADFIAVRLPVDVPANALAAFLTPFAKTLSTTAAAT
ncbi:MAG: thiamine phosphate synthase [Deltaproteobacteria bacterium]